MLAVLLTILEIIGLIALVAACSIGGLVLGKLVCGEPIIPRRRRPF